MAVARDEVAEETVEAATARVAMVLARGVVATAVVAAAWERAAVVMAMRRVAGVPGEAHGARGGG